MEILQSIIDSHPSCCRVATSFDTVLNSECCYTFYNPYHHPSNNDATDSDSSGGGILVNLNTFIGTIQELATKNTSSTGATELYVRICKTRIPKLKIDTNNDNNEATAPTKLAIGVDGGFRTSDSDLFDTISSYSVVAIDPNDGSVIVELPYDDSTKADFPEILRKSVDSIVNHTGIITQQQIDETWEDEPIPITKFYETIPFVDNGVTISPDPKTWKCAKMGATENLWLNLSDGYIGGGRKHWDGSGGSNGALDHYNETGQLYPLVVKLGTITADINTADCYSYDPSEDGPVKIPNLGELLAKRGIKITALEKTVKSTAELEVELNANYAFDAITESGSELQPVAFQGLQNLGNSCYMNSAVQCLLTLPELSKRYGATNRNELLNHRLLQLSTSPKNAITDVICQTTKLTSALVSNLFIQPIKDKTDAIGSLDPKYRLAPRMFKHCIGKDHIDFKTSQQQDSAQYVQYLLEKLDQAEISAYKKDPTSFGNTSEDSLFLSSYPFQFTTTNRLASTIDTKVKYKTNTSAESILSLRVPMDKAMVKKSSVTDDTVITSPDQKRLKPDESGDEDTMDVVATNSDVTNNFEESKQETTDRKEKDVTKEIPSIPLQVCFEEWGADTIVDGVRWLHIQDTVSTIQRTRLTNFPRYLIVQIQRYELGPDWQPIKLEVNIEIPDDEIIDITHLKSTGPSDDEDILVEDDDNDPTAHAQQQSTTTVPKSPSVVIDEMALSQLMDMGFTLNSCKRALSAVGGTDVEAAMGWVFEHNMDPDFNDPLPDSSDGTGSTPSNGNTSSGSGVDEGIVASLVENLGCFTPDQVRYALKECNNAPDRAADWLFSHMDDLDTVLASAAAAQSTEGNNVTTNKVVKPPLEDSSSGKYTLFGMISHIGKNTGSGHYVAHIKKHIDGEYKWVIFNDEKVALSFHPPKEHAYLYIFQRTDTIGTIHPGY